MKKLIAALCVVSVLALAAQAGDAKSSNSQCPYATAMKDMVAKYDADKDGKLSKEEKASMTAEDKAALKDAKKAMAKMNSKDAAACTKDPASCTKDAAACTKDKCAKKSSDAPATGTK